MEGLRFRFYGFMGLGFRLLDFKVWGSGLRFGARVWG